jgi:RecJ-like exonuclease
MKRRVFFALAALLAIGSCARMDKREARYDASECPFCSVTPGECSYCHGSKKCAHCNGTGVRKTGSPVIAEENIGATSYEEKCPYCSGTGTCRYCRGKGICWACDGDGKVESWDFYEKYQEIIGKKTSQATGQPQTQSPETQSPVTEPQTKEQQGQ